MKSSRESVNVTNELFRRSRQSSNKISTCIRKFAEQKTAESPCVNKPVPLAGNVKATFIVAFSSDDTLMASTHGDHHVRVTDVRTQECIRTLVGHPRTPWCVTFHPSSNEILASGCLGGEVRVWDLHGGSEVWVSEHHSTISSLAFHPLDQVLAIATSNQIFLWNWSQPKAFASVKTACLAERVRLIRFSARGDFLLTGISNLPKDDTDLNVARKLMFNSGSNPDIAFQRRVRRVFQFRQDDSEDLESNHYPHSSRHSTEVPYTQTAEYRVRRASARRDRLHMAEAALTRASNQSREIHSLLSSRLDGNAMTSNDLHTDLHALHQDSRSLLAQARDYAASVTLETVANRATDALVSGEVPRPEDAVSHREVFDSVLSNMHNHSEPELPDNASELQNLNALTQRRTNSVLRTAIEQRNFRERRNTRLPTSSNSAVTQSESNDSQSSIPTALELRTIFHPELSFPSTTEVTSRVNSNTSNLSSPMSDEASGSRSVPHSGTRGEASTSSSSVECPHSSTSTPAEASHSSRTFSQEQGCSYWPSTSKEQNQMQRTQSSCQSSSSSSSRYKCPHHEHRKAMMRKNVMERRERLRERNLEETRRIEQDGQRPNDAVGLSTIRRIARRVQSPGPLTRCWSSRRKSLQYRGRLTLPADDTHRDVRRSRVGVHRLSRAMERVRPPQQPLHRHYDVSIFDEEVGRPSRNVHAVVNRAIADAFNIRGETAVANNIKNTTHRLQWWDFTRQELPDISNENASVIVPHCKIHNDNSCDLSQDSQLLATFVPSPYGFPDNGVLAVYSLKQHNFGHVLYTKSFGPNAICTSISPMGGYVTVGLAARRLHCWHQSSRRMMAQVFRMEEPYAGENSLVQVNSVLHDGDVDQRHQVSVNVVKWIPSPGAGMVYGTNKGDLRICVASAPTVDDDLNQLFWRQSANGNGDMYSRYSIDPAQRARLYNDISLMALGIQFPDDQDNNRTETRLLQVARSTQTGEEYEVNDRQSTSTQTEQPLREALSQPSQLHGSASREVDEVGVPSIEYPNLARPRVEHESVEQPDARVGGSDDRGDVSERQNQQQNDESRDHETGESV
ncbi:activating molecule in BECN1-regulated autophagy protein 1-like isoform X2 [Anneissia japonica]|uniref:activating molecule in BECN1-regulated autophagy protein 1-like isoform X2 n=1 Tax=Anneissia japonica TaxID=1529436 RepID=UPI0014256C88|nr:activating molecule in BECN1-regulated autophagy protein 1-like isoform X2 [Anneissia japonica]